MVFPFKCKDFDLLARREGDTDHQFRGKDNNTSLHRVKRAKERNEVERWDMRDDPENQVHDGLFPTRCQIILPSIDHGYVEK